MTCPARYTIISIVFIRTQSSGEPDEEHDRRDRGADHDRPDCGRHGGLRRAQAGGPGSRGPRFLDRRPPGEHPDPVRIRGQGPVHQFLGDLVPALPQGDPRLHRGLQGAQGRGPGDPGRLRRSDDGRSPSRMGPQDRHQLPDRPGHAGDRAGLRAGRIHPGDDRRRPQGRHPLPPVRAHGQGHARRAFPALQVGRQAGTGRCDDPVPVP
ncbi:MAG: hypothetical protein MZV64_10890 [Ignavibacteriales bacterium]|nr:hypothetical protein [Ignavibacteriales bacterium]